MGWKKSKKKEISMQSKMDLLAKDFLKYQRETNLKIQLLEDKLEYMSTKDYLISKYDEIVEILEKKDEVVLILDRIKNGICFELGRNKVYQREYRNRQEYIEIQASGEVTIEIYFFNTELRQRTYNFNLGDYKTIYNNTLYVSYLKRIERLLFTE